MLKNSEKTSILIYNIAASSQWEQATPCEISQQWCYWAGARGVRTALSVNTKQYKRIKTKTKHLNGLFSTPPGTPPTHITVPNGIKHDWNFKNKGTEGGIKLWNSSTNLSWDQAQDNTSASSKLPVPYTLQRLSRYNNYASLWLSDVLFWKQIMLPLRTRWQSKPEAQINVLCLMSSGSLLQATDLQLRYGN